MKTHPLIRNLVFSCNVAIAATVAVSLPGGCARQTAPVIEPLPINTFAKNWQADLQLQKDPVTALYPTGDAVVAYTESNRGYWLSAAGGQLRASGPITAPGHTLHPPLAFTDGTVIPTTGSLEVFNLIGVHIRSFELPTPAQSPASVAGNSLYLGIAHQGSGRLARMDINANGFTRVWELYTASGIVSTPATFADEIFFAESAGNVIGVTSDRRPLWGTLPDNSFKTAAAITADLAADDYGLYIPSQDKKLYVLDRPTGKLKWSYFAGMPLLEKPIVVGNVVYQIVPNRGLAAINKVEGNFARDAMWVQPDIVQFLASDDQYVYARGKDNSIVALDKAKGNPAFRTMRKDLKVFATNTASPNIFAATKDGSILSIRAVLRPGSVGELVTSERRSPAQSAAPADSDHAHGANE